jgi:hypothetical protein
VGFAVGDEDEDGCTVAGLEVRVRRSLRMLLADGGVEMEGVDVERAAEVDKTDVVDWLGSLGDVEERGCVSEFGVFPPSGLLKLDEVSTEGETELVAAESPLSIDVLAVEPSVQLDCAAFSMDVVEPTGAEDAVPDAIMILPSVEEGVGKDESCHVELEVDDVLSTDEVDRLTMILDKMSSHDGEVDVDSGVAPELNDEMSDELKDVDVERSVQVSDCTDDTTFEGGS